MERKRRGYYYEKSLFMYYLGSRYYDQRAGRFINPDEVMSGTNGSLQGFNLYVYCFNNPITYTDPNGNWPKLRASTPSLDGDFLFDFYRKFIGVELAVTETVIKVEDEFKIPNVISVKAGKEMVLTAYVWLTTGQYVGSPSYAYAY